MQYEIQLGITDTLTVADQYNDGENLFVVSYAMPIKRGKWASDRKYRTRLLQLATDEINQLIERMTTDETSSNVKDTTPITENTGRESEGYGGSY